MSDTTSNKQFDRLMDGQRVLGASRVLREGEEVTREAAERVIANLHAFTKRIGVSAAYVARSLGIAGSTLSQVLSWKYAGDWQSIVVDVDRWLEEELRRESAPRPARFVQTEVAREVFTVAEIAAKLKTIGLVYGPSGIGKSLALQAVAADKPGAVYVSIESAGTSPLGVLESISRALRVDPGMGSSQRIIAHRIKQTLKGTSRLLIIDEIHKLTERKHDTSFHVLRDLFDQTDRAPQLWCGTTDLMQYFDRGAKSGREPLAQIRRRIGVRRDLLQRTRAGGGGDPGGGGGAAPLFNIDEIRAVFGRGKMRLAPDAERYLTMLANLPDGGGLGACYNLVVMATEINAGRAMLTAELLQAAQSLLMQDREFFELRQRLEQPRPMVKVG